MITLIPYVELNGMRTIPDDIVFESFDIMVREGTQKTVFYNGSVKTRESFLEFMKDTRNLPVFVMYDNVISGIFWINGLHSNFAFAHFCLFKNAWGDVSKEIGHKVLEYWFSIPDKDGNSLFDLIIGIIPSFNKKAESYVRSLGFKKVGDIPNMIKTNSNHNSAAMLFYFER